MDNTVPVVFSDNNLQITTISLLSEKESRLLYDFYFYGTEHVVLGWGEVIL